MKSNSKTAGHLAAALTIFIWGTTFISTKVLLNDFTPIEILFFRFGIGFITLFLVNPRPLGKMERKQELLFMAAGLCGVTLYFLMENIALLYTLASNVGVILCVAPFFTAIFSYKFLHTEKPKGSFFIGFVVAMAGISLISFNGATAFSLNPLGDFLAILAAVLWAAYSTLTRKIGEMGYSTVQSTRKTFFYGLIFMIPVLIFAPFEFGFARFAQPVYLFNVLYLGLGASAMCFVTWNVAVKILGAVKTSIYIYLTPVVTVVTSFLVLGEKITWMSGLGTILTMIGLVISERKSADAGEKQEEECRPA